MRNRQSELIGYFDDEIEAAQAYNKAAIDMYGEFARLNTIPKGGNQDEDQQLELAMF
jgi:hypothetical protein